MSKDTPAKHQTPNYKLTEFQTRGWDPRRNRDVIHRTWKWEAVPLRKSRQDLTPQGGY